MINPPNERGRGFFLIGRNIRDLRISQGIYQQDLAAMLNIEKSNMSRIEYGRTNLTVRTLYRISTALGVPLSRVVDIEAELLRGK